jgi:hypothetical protein
MRTLRLIAGAALAMTLVALGTAHAGVERAGTTAADFLSLGTGARALSMGGATLGLGDDLGAAGWNPAAAGWLDGYQAVLAHAALADRSNQEWGAIGGRIKSSRTRWAATGLYQGDGSFEGRDASGNPTGGFSDSSMALGAMVSQALGEHVTVGLGAKWVNERIAAASGSGVTFDGGLMARAGKLGVGVAAQNVGGRMSYAGSSYPFPASYGAGVAFIDPATGLRLALDANLPSTYHPDLRLGAEWTYHGALALRAGYRREMAQSADPLNGPTFGLGARAGTLWIDYGYLLPQDQSGQHRMGMRFQFGAPHAPAAAAAPAKAAPQAKAAPAKAKPEKKADAFDWARDGNSAKPGKP